VVPVKLTTDEWVELVLMHGKSNTSNPPLNLMTNTQMGLQFITKIFEE
jgi:hypothetical protein